MALDVNTLKETANQELARLDRIAAATAFVSTVVLLIVLELHWATAILLGQAIYVGVWLLRDPTETQQEPEPDPYAEERQYLVRCREASRQIEASIPELAGKHVIISPSGEVITLAVKKATRDQISLVVEKIERMVNAIEQDAELNPSRLATAPLYFTKLVQHFDRFLAKLHHLLDRKVILAAEHLDQFENRDLPQFVKAAEEFYQEYHDQEVLDLAALSEILRYNLESVSEWEDDDLNDDDQFDDLASSAAYPRNPTSPNGTVGVQSE
ncbi:MAG: hypothetical protein AB7V46_13255, partial [Thermomicrobiales bacterium]